MAELPFMPLKTDVLLADTAHLTAEEFGAYMRLLVTMWRVGGFLDNNPAQLARIAGLGTKKWKKISTTLMAFMNSESGKISQKRLLATLADVRDKRRKRAIAAGHRWGNEKSRKLLNSHGLSYANAEISHMHRTKQNNDFASLNQNKKEDSSTSSESVAAREGLQDEAETKGNVTLATSARDPGGFQENLADIVRRKGWVR